MTNYESVIWMDHESNEHTVSTEKAVTTSEKPHVTDSIYPEEDAEKVPPGPGPECLDPNCFIKDPSGGRCTCTEPVKSSP